MADGFPSLEPSGDPLVDDLSPMSPRIVVAITTHNRADLLDAQLEAILRLTASPVDIVVCDDGSTDHTAQVTRKWGVQRIGGDNRGIAYNKNRGIFYAREIAGCSHLLILDDDIIPIEQGWELFWIDAIDRHGHINFGAPDYDKFIVWGDKTPERPGLNTHVVGQCLGASRDALVRTGYMDTRFGRYGFEHVEYSWRMAKLGYGGVIIDGELLLLVISGGLERRHAESSGAPEDIEVNAKVYERLRSEYVYRAPAHTPELLNLFMSEFTEYFQPASPIAGSRLQLQPEGAARFAPEGSACGTRLRSDDYGR
jgi:glycosyltransferase involved in cell wall biosynthesis